MSQLIKSNEDVIVRLLNSDSGWGIFARWKNNKSTVRIVIRGNSAHFSMSTAKISTIKSDLIVE